MHKNYQGPRHSNPPTKLGGIPCSIPMTEKQDKAMDKMQGVKEDSAKDKKLDKEGK